MASKGIDFNTLLIVGGVVAGLYFAKDMFKSSADIAQSREAIVDTRQDNRTERVEIRNETFRQLISGLRGETDYVNPVDQTVKAMIQQVTSIDPVVRIQDQTQTAFNMPTTKVTTATGKTSTIIVAPNTYNPKLGIGFNSQGQGYSSAYAGNKVTSGAPTGAQVSALIRANPKFN